MATGADESRMDPFLAPDRLLVAYASGIFPMADDEGVVRWMAPDPRAVLELDAFVVSRSLRCVLRQGVFDLTVNKAFEEVMCACADRPEGTWISQEILQAYTMLHRLGFAHRVEAWQEQRLAGGLYGVSLGGAFFAESMFHRVSNASKVAMAHLVDRLRERGFQLLDVQFMTEHLRSVGAVEIPRDEYEKRLQSAVVLPCRFADTPNGDTEDTTA